MSNDTAVRDRRRGHFWLHDDVLDVYAKQLGVYGLAVYTMLCRRANKGGESWPSVRRLAEDLDISERQVKRELKKLEDLKLIHIQRRNEENKASLYTLLEVPWPQDSESPAPRTDSHPKEYTDKKGGLEANASSGIKDPADAVRLNYAITKEIFDHMKEKGQRLPSTDFKYQLGRAQDMLDNDAPTQQELDDLPQAFLDRTKIYGKADACSALFYMRQQRGRQELMNANTQATPQDDGPRPRVPLYGTRADGTFGIIEG